MKTPVLATILFLATCATALCQEQQSKKTAAKARHLVAQCQSRQTTASATDGSTGGSKLK
jgi:hypothetical protein